MKQNCSNEFGRIHTTENNKIEQYKAMNHEMDVDPVDAYKAIEEGVVETYKMIEEGVVDGYKKVEGAFVDAFLTEGEAAPAIEDEAAEKYKVMERDLATDTAEAAELGAQTVVKAMSEAVVGAYKTIEEDVVGAYKKVEEGFVGAYKKVEDTFVEKFFAKEGESVEDAKKRLQGK